MPSRRWQLGVKRLLDLLGASLGLVFLGPFMLFLALLIRLESAGPAFFQQWRLGREGRSFTMYKLRSMKHGAPMVLNPDGSTRVVAGDSRLTRVGRVLRRLGLDELPQLLNVLCGEMSLVGPRPDPDFQLQHYTQEDYAKLAMRPGITSLAQVSGRNSLSWRERMVLEIEYVNRFSLWLDAKILLRTVGVVLRGGGVAYPTAWTEQARQESVSDPGLAPEVQD